MRRHVGYTFAVDPDLTAVTQGVQILRAGSDHDVIPYRFAAKNTALFLRYRSCHGNLARRAGCVAPDLLGWLPALWDAGSCRGQPPLCWTKQPAYRERSRSIKDWHTAITARLCTVSVKARLAGRNWSRSPATSTSGKPRIPTGPCSARRSPFTHGC